MIISGSSTNLDDTFHFCVSNLFFIHSTSTGCSNEKKTVTGQRPVWDICNPTSFYAQLWHGWAGTWILHTKFEVLDMICVDA